MRHRADATALSVGEGTLGVPRTLRPPPARPGVATRNVTLTTLALASSGSTTLAFNIVLARVLDQETFGDVTRTFSLAMAVAQLTMAGVVPAMARAVAYGTDEAARRGLASASLPWLMAIVGASSALYLPLAAAGLAPMKIELLILGWSLALIYALYFGLKMILFSLDRAALYAVLEWSVDIAFFALLVVLAAVEPMVALLAFVIAYAAFDVVAIAVVGFRRGAERGLRISHELLRYAALASIATYSSIARFPLVIALTGALASSRESAQIAIVIALAMPLFLLPQAAGVLTFASVARAQGQGRGVRETTRIVAAVSGLVILGGTLLARPLVSAVFGEVYATTSSALVVVLVCLAPLLVAGPAANALAAQGSVGLTSAISLTGFAIALAVAALTVPPHGALGAAIAIGASSAFTGVAVLVVSVGRFALGVLELAAGAGVLLGAAVVAVLLEPDPLIAAALLALVTALALPYARRAAREVRSA